MQSEIRHTGGDGHCEATSSRPESAQIRSWKRPLAHGPRVLRSTAGREEAGAGAGGGGGDSLTPGNGTSVWEGEGSGVHGGDGFTRSP